MSSSDSAFLGQVLRAHDASGELLGARIRVVVCTCAALLVALGASGNTAATNLVLALSAALYLLYAVAWWRWRTLSAQYESWVSYVSVTVDLTFCHAIAVASLLNHSGAYEVYRSPLLWLALAAANGLTALRGNPRVSWFSLAVTLAYGAVLFSWVLLSGSVSWVPSATYVGPGLNLTEVLFTHIFVTLPAIVASRVARRSSNLVIETAKRERIREQERAQLEWRLKVADRMVTVGTMAAGVAHEVNNPLTYVLHHIDIAADRLKGERHLTDVHAHLERAQSGAQRVQAIVASLRTFSRIDDGPRQPIDLRATIDAALTMASFEVKHRAKVDIDQEESFTVLGSEAKLGQVFLNLIVNAAQSISTPDPQHHRICVRIFREDERAVVEVSDTGSGIPPEHLSRIFDPFFTTKPVGSGTGLGLSIVHAIVEELSGTIDVRSTLGRGTTFSVRLPISELAPPRTSSIQPIPPRHMGSVLVVDDDRLVSEAVELMLCEDHKVELAGSADEALSRIRSGQHYDAIVCDLMMPGMSGIELFFELESEQPLLAQRVLFATGGAFSRPAQAFVERMGPRVITKPFRSDELRAKVRKLVAQSLALPKSARVDARDGSAHQ